MTPQVSLHRCWLVAGGSLQILVSAGNGLSELVLAQASELATKDAGSAICSVNSRDLRVWHAQRNALKQAFWHQIKVDYLV